MPTKVSSTILNSHYPIRAALIGRTRLLVSKSNFGFPNGSEIVHTAENTMRTQVHTYTKQRSSHIKTFIHLAVFAI